MFNDVVFDSATGGWTLYDGLTMKGAPILTFVRGQQVFKGDRLLVKAGHGKFQPMGRPGWMELMSAGKLKKVKFHKSMLPVGNVVRLGGMDEALES